MQRPRAVIALLIATLAACVAAAPAGASGGGDRGAQHSLRSPVTDETFYFVMADRFANGDTANDHGGLPPGTGDGQSGFDRTRTGFYQGATSRACSRRSTTSAGSARRRSG